jgi:uncharacterized SAM-binding protein YcdF (DUF218 family)
VAVLAVGVVHVGVTSILVWRSAGSQPDRSADAIVVLGAAQYDGDPSPVLAARLDHGLGLWRDGVAPLLVVTGGNQEGDRFTEATVGADFLHDRGVPDDVILREVDGRSTYESLAAAARFLRERNLDTVVVVSDPYHSHRVRGIAREVGLEVSVSPAPGGSATARDLVRETVASAVAAVVGHRRLTSWTD